MNDPIALNKYLREVLALAPRRRFTERMLFDGMKRLTGGELTVDEFKAAIEWNHSRNLAEFKYDDDLQADTWALTAKGKAKEGVK